MNKKVREVSKSVIKQKKYDDKEDLDIKEMAYTHTKRETYLLYTVIIIFIFILCYLTFDFASKFANKDNPVVYESGYNRNQVVIVNNGIIKEEVSNKSFTNNNNELVVEKINSIELIADKKLDKKAQIKYDLKYDISKNTFTNNLYSSSNSEVLLRISYSRDGENWTYINNVLSTPDSTINPLTGNYYDIAGIERELKILTGMQLEANINSSNKVYWRSETIFRKKDKNINGTLDANFKIEYREWK